VVYWQAAGGNWYLFMKPTDSSGSANKLVESKYRLSPNSWSPDGQYLAYTQVHPDTQGDLWLLPTAGNRSPQLFVGTQFNEQQAMFSPDGGWIAYVSDESGTMQVYVQSFLGDRKRLLVSPAGGTEPIWSPSGQELFYRNGDRVMAVPVVGQPELTVGKPRSLFEGTYFVAPGINPSYDVSPDGRRFLMIASQDAGPEVEIRVVLNWFEELKRLVPNE
jgi:serine/threonine-protein kinase